MAVQIQRGTCPVCRTEQKLTANGTVDHHRRTVRGRLTEACPGRWKQPADTAGGSR
ncbi:hypothetical protein [Actinomadura alba]|uniref:Uncharacterized protein n=1 Tax=Actinomadura alba TaxID=406431 RepID=A0ABR7LHP7_9ACTN|nr:hypothetical protein [Actinomadura alba]MBC6464295.1 hypothetical protein [Actinomadura alba]